MPHACSPIRRRSPCPRFHSPAGSFTGCGSCCSVGDEGHARNSMKEQIAQRLRDLAATATSAADTLGPDAERAGTMMRDVLRNGGTLFFCGNGGSAADAQHMATEYVVRYARNRKAYPAVALTTDTSLLTAVGNDFGFDFVFSRQVEALFRPGDLLVIHSTSGNSPNVLEAAKAAR